jgi:rfaE bifunctional protein kinase chain/domain
MTVPEILAGIPRLRILIAGDICLDRWCTYDPKHREPSRETGIDRIGVVQTVVTPGGGGTVANNVAALGAGQVSVLGVAGDDGFGFELARSLNDRGIDSTHLIRSSALQTFTYTKLINSSNRVEDQPRIDFIHSEPLASDLEKQLLDRLRQIESGFDAIIALDQSETPESGVVTAGMRDWLSQLSNKIVWADSRIRSELFRGVTVKVNRQEAAAACHRLNIPVDYAKLRDALAAPRLFVTDGAAGVHIVTSAGLEHVATKPVENPVDICGAGDSFSAGAVCAIALGASESEAANFGNLVASITVMKPGTGTASPSELLALCCGTMRD